MTIHKTSPILVSCILALLLSGCGVLPRLGGGTDIDTERLDRALAHRRVNAHAHFLLGRAALEERRPAEASGHFRRAIDLLPAFEEAHEGLGVSYLDRHRYGKAMGVFAEMAERFPRSAAAHEGLATASYAQGRMEDCARHADKALELHPGSPQALRLLGEVAYAGGDLRQAVTHWRAAVEGNPSLGADYRPLIRDVELFLEKYPPE